MLFSKTYTVESVTSGHPDKICDQISDAILDQCLRHDPKSRVAVESFGCHGLLVVGGEVTSNAKVNWEEVSRRVYKDIGHTDPISVKTRIVQQSPDIAQGVDTGGAGDQGIMYGFATDETEQMLPKTLVDVHRLAQGLEVLRKSKKEFCWLKPDGKTQLTVEDGRVTKVLVSTQHDGNIAVGIIKGLLTQYLIEPVIGNLEGVEILVNPTGKFEIGGFEADTGLTGRKIMVDTYGGLIPHGGGAFSGKDPSKVDRSATYMARFVAKNLIKLGAGKRILVSVAYAIGQAKPLMIEAVNEKGKSLAVLVKEKFDFRPRAIIERLGLQAPIYSQTAVYGHFTKQDLPWENLDL